MQEQRIEELGNLITQYGWSYKYYEPCTFETGWQIRNKRFPLLITGNDSFICFSVNLTCLHGLSLTQQGLVLRVLNNFNNRSYFVRTFLNANNEFLLNADIFNQNKIEYNDFRLSLSLLTYYSHHLYREVSKIIKGGQQSFN